MMITILYIYKNKDLDRVKKSLDSLNSQISNEFKVVFINYGSNLEYTNALEEVLESYTFVELISTYAAFQPWSRSKAINIGLKSIWTPYVFVSDIDMIFRNDFVEKLKTFAAPKKVTYFKVGFLNEQESNENKAFQDYNIAHYSKAGAQGLSLFPVEELKQIGGFDEFYHFWGAEDEDVNVRLKNVGVQIDFYEDETLMLHQWHPSYRNSEQKKLTQDLQLTGIVRLNHEHLKEAIRLKKTEVNAPSWGNLIKKIDFERLQNCQERVVLTNKKETIDHFLFYTLHQKNTKAVRYQFVVDPVFSTLKYKLKKIAGKKVASPYALKQINDKILLHLVGLGITEYQYQVADDLKSISLVFVNHIKINNG